MQISINSPIRFFFALFGVCGLALVGVSSLLSAEAQETQRDKTETITAAGSANAEDHNQVKIGSPAASLIRSDQFTGILPDEARRQLGAELDLLREATGILEADPPISPDKLSKATDLSRRVLTSIEAKTTTLPVDDARSLFWEAMLSDAWCVAGWTAIENNDLSAAENYLRSSWQVSQDKTSGYLLARTLEAKGNKIGAAYLFGLASVARTDNPLGLLGFSFLNNYQTEKDFRKWALKSLPTSIPTPQEYEDPRRAEIGKQDKVQLFVHPTKLEGTALFLVAFETGKPIKVNWYGDDAALAPLAHTIESHSFASVFPKDSRAQLLREVRVVCKTDTGCDAYFQMPTRIDIPATSVNTDILKPPLVKGIKMITVQLQPE
jgi:hypothetical protein